MASLLFERYFKIKFSKMKDEDLQKLSMKRVNLQRKLEWFCELSNHLTMVRETGTINLSHSLGRPRIIRTKGMIEKMKKRMKCKKRISIRKLAGELDISNRSVVRILKQNLGYRSYKKRVRPALTKVKE